MARQVEANENMKNQALELECQINQGLRNRQAIIENLGSQFKFLEKKNQPFESFPRTTKTKLRHEFVYKPPFIQNENDKGDVESIEDDEIKPILNMQNPNLSNSNSPSCCLFLRIAPRISRTFLFEHDEMSNYVGDKELKLIDGVGTRRMIKKEKDDKGVPKETNKEWKLSEKAVPHNKENVYHYLWHPTQIPHLNRIIKES
ncbi:hypothetical protein Tco_1492746 [Tanacetum coccineum]